MRRVLGIDVDDEVVDRWRAWFAPAVQLFRTSGLSAEVVDAVGGDPVESPALELIDTFHAYGSTGTWVGLDEARFRALPAAVRRALARNRQPMTRRVVWPSAGRDAIDRALLPFVQHGLRPSRHREVPAAVCTAAEAQVPGARFIAGTFSDSSGPNCFGTVMAACGVAGADEVWAEREPFETWLAERAVPVRGTAEDDEPGTVLVWREGGLVAHAAVTIGGEWCFSKASQGWYSPRVVLTVRDTILQSRFPGGRLERHRLR